MMTRSRYSDRGGLLRHLVIQPIKGVCQTVRRRSAPARWSRGEKENPALWAGLSQTGEDLKGGRTKPRGLGCFALLIVLIRTDFCSVNEFNRRYKGYSN